MPLIDLSHTVVDGMTTYPGLPGPVVSSHQTFEQSAAVYAEGTEFQIGRIEMVANTGTYLDTPAHRYRDGLDLTGMPLETCADLPTTVLAVTDALEIGPELLRSAGLGPDAKGHAVLLHTGWSRHWRTERYGDPFHPHLTEAGAHALVESGVRLVGIDSVNLDDTRTGVRPAHSVLLAAEIAVVEHLTDLDRVPARGARLHAVPPRIEGMATFPVRAYVVAP